MKSITVGELRQNPTSMLDDVAAGETYRITRHGREVGRVIPSSSGAGLIPPKRKGAMRLVDVPRHVLRSAASLDELLDGVKGEW